MILKAYRVLYTLRTMRSCTELLRQRLVQALIFPYLNYCSTILLDATNEQKTKLQKLQNSCMRFIYGLRWDARITPCRERLNWMRTDTRRTYFSGILLYKFFNLHSPSYLLNLFRARKFQRPTREVTGDLEIPQVYSEFGIRSFRFRGVYLWNSIPKEIKYLLSLSRFKSAFRSYLYTWH